MSLTTSLKSLFGALALTVLAACGGGGGSAGESLFPPAAGANPTTVASDLVIVLSKSTITNSGSDSVEATITALDANRNALSGVTVAVSVDADAIAQVPSAVTDTGGSVKATLTIGNRRDLRTVTVTARASGLTRAQSFQVTNELGGGAAAASDLVVVLDKTTIDNSGTESVQATITALDANRNALAGVPVSLSINNGAVLVPTGTLTNAEGQIKANLSIGSDSSLRTVTLTARSGAVGATRSFQVVGSAAAGGTVASDLVVVLDRNTLTNTATTPLVATVTTLDANRNALAGVPVQVSVDSGAIATVSSPTSNTSGQVTANVSLGSDKSLRTITVTARSGSLARAQAFQVTSGSGAGATLVASDLVLQLNKSVMSSSGTDVITATVMALDANRNAIAGIPVTVAVDSNAVAAVSASTTNAQGVITASLTAGDDRAARIVRVTATSGTVVKTTTFEVSATNTVTTVQASALVIGLSARSVANTGTQSVTVTATTLDARRNALGGVPVQFSINSGGVIVPAGTLTAADGTLTAVARIGVDRSNRTIQVTATSGTLSSTEIFQVEGADLSGTLLPAVVSTPGSSGNQIQYRLIDRNANPMVNFPITVSAPGLQPVTGTTGVNGEYNYLYTAPSLPAGQTSTELVFTAAAAGVDRQDTVQIGQVTRPDAVGPVVSASIDPSPSVVSTNLVGNTSNRSEIRAVFLGQNNRPVPNLRVVFDLNTDPNTVGGTMVSGSQVVYTDQNGVATTAYVPGTRSSPTDGVTVRACYALTGSALTCPATATALADIGASSGAVTKKLTVVSNAVSVTVGTDELISLGTGTYIKDYVVMVVDSAGNAKPDVVITPSLDLTGYYKGIYTFASRWTLVNTLDENQGYRWNSLNQSWESLPGGAPEAPNASSGIFFSNTGRYLQPMCPGEDVDRNSALFSGTGIPGSRPLAQRGEDMNDNGSLDPRKSDVSVRVISANGKTGANGTAIIRLEYPRNYATWVDFRITVQATGVSGTEGRAVYVGTRYGVGNLPAPSDVLADENLRPAFAVSPYGRSGTCQDDK